jgi:IclR family transcriptional regulator, acetate operon repressor
MSGHSTAADAPRRVQSVERAFDLLHLIALTDAGAALSELAASSGLPVPTIHRLLRSLVDSGHVVQLSSRRYALGPRMLGLGQSAGRTLDGWAHAHLTRLAELTGETANLAMLDVDDVVYLAQVSSQRHIVRMFTEVGSRVSPHCTGVGKALLAELPTETAREIVTAAGMPARTRHTITDPDELVEELARIRAAGHAVDDEEHELGVRCVAVVVRGLPATAISVSGPASRLTRPALGRLVPAVRAAARDLGEALGRPRELLREAPDGSRGRTTSSDHGGKRSR